VSLSQLDIQQNSVTFSYNNGFKHLGVNMFNIKLSGFIKNNVLRKTVIVVLIFFALSIFFSGMAHNSVVLDIYGMLRVHLGSLGFKPAKLWIHQREIAQYAPVLVLALVITFQKFK
jgi:hypothetical protein